VGYVGVGYFDFEGRTWLEWGYRPVPECRGLGYATDASQALLAKAHQTYVGELLAMVAVENLASQNVCRKLGFTFWKQATVEGHAGNLYTLPVGEPTWRPDRAGPRLCLVPIRRPGHCVYGLQFKNGQHTLAQR
jgi:hypothetical protein